MNELNTDRLEEVLASTHSKDFSSYISDNKDSIVDMSNDFYSEYKNILFAKGITQREVFKLADISEKTGYKLLSGEKPTKRRDVIIRLAVAAKLDLKDVQRLIRKYGMPELYAKFPRDALIMMAVNEGKNIYEINSLLTQNDFEILETLGS